MSEVAANLGSCCRRRTITGRILPAVLQIVLVVAVWEILKSLTSPADDEDNIGREWRNARSVDQANCPPSSISHANVLRILDLGSIISAGTAPEPSRDQHQTHHLKTDLYVRDQKQNTVTLYRAGTLINFGDILAGFVSAQKDEVKCQGNKDSNDINGNGEEPAGFDAKIDSSFDSKKTDDKPTRMDGTKQVIFDYEHRSEKINKAGNEVAIEETGRDESGMVGMRMEDERMQQNSLSRLRPFPGADRSQQMFGNIFGQQSNKITDLGQTNEFKERFDPFQYPGNLNKNPAQTLQDEEFQQEKAFNLQQSDLSYRHVIPYSNNRLEYQDQNSPHNVQQKIATHLDKKANSGVFNDIDRTLHAEGFLERAKKLKSELYGKLRNDSLGEIQSNFLHLNCPNACHGLKNLDVVFVINSAPQNVEMRQRIRNTFVKSSNFQGFTIAHVFLLGQAMSQNFQQQLNQEQRMYEDIVQGSFLDISENSALKGLMGMRWVSQFCPEAKFVMSINEDVFVDTEKLVRGLIPAAMESSGNRVMLCYFKPESPITRSGPNAISVDLFPGRTYLRPYCRSFAILMTQEVISSLLAAADYVQPIHLNELYLYGILPFVSGNIEVYDVGSKRAFHDFDIDTVNCYKTMMDKCPLVASVAFNDRFTELWSIVQARMLRPHSEWNSDPSLWNIQTYKRKF